MNPNKHIALLFLCLFFPFGLYGQAFTQFSNIDYLTSEDGLSQNEITCMLQDRKGFLWIGTRGGLNRYDGSSFKIFQNEIGNVNSLINNSIESLLEDSKGNLWIGTKSNGLSCYNPEFGSFSHYQVSERDSNSISGNRVVSIAESPKGAIWIGTWENGLNILDVETGRSRQLLSNQKINYILQAKDGRMWVVASSGLHLFSQDGAFLNYFNPKGRAIQFNCILEEKNSEKLYLGTWKLGLWEFDLKTTTFQNYLNYDNSPPNVYRLYQDKQGRIWTGSWRYGLTKFDSHTNSFSKMSLTSDNNEHYSPHLYRDVLSIFQDKLRTLWIGTNGGGLCKIDERNNSFGLMEKSGTKRILPHSPIWSILSDKKQGLWIGTKGSGVIYYAQNGFDFSKINLPNQSLDSLPIVTLGVRAIYQSQDDKIWAASNYSLYKIEKNSNGKFDVSLQHIKLKEKQMPARLSQISVMYQTSDGFFWIGQQQVGLKKSLYPGNPSNQLFKSYNFGSKTKGLKSNRISAMLEDRTGRFWIGTYNGLHLYRPSSDDFLHYSKIPGNVHSLSSDIITCLHEDQNGNLWIGTPNGLNLAIPEINQSLSFKCFQEKDGLPNNFIKAILEDDHGNLWISTNKGISKYNLKESQFYNYDVNDGLRSNSFADGVAIKDSRGQFFFGGHNGLSAFHPDSIRPDTRSPQVVLTGLKIFNKEIQAGDLLNGRVILKQSLPYSQHICLTHKENIFTIDYTALDFQNAKGNTFKYKMEGLDEEWNYAGTQRSITYSNLNPGNYTFKVKAANNSGIWSEKAVTLQIEIRPPFWATWQAFLLYTLVFLGLMLLYRRFIHAQNDLKNKLKLAKVERQKEIELTELKTRFFTNITHELRSPLTLISGPIAAMIEKGNISDDHKNYLATVHHHTQRLLSLVNQLLDFRKAKSGNMDLKVAQGDFVKFSREIFLSFQEMAERKNILFQFHITHHIIPLYYDRDKMEIVLCNLLSNAFKYTPDNKSISVFLSQHPLNKSSHFPLGYCELIVEDTGQGMAQEVVDRIFDRFYQIANANSVKVIGTGIGLSLVKNIVELHKGKVFVQSEEGKGSKFIVQFPLGKTHFQKNQFIPNFRNSEHKSHYQAGVLSTTINSQTVKSRMSMEKSDLPKLLIVEDNKEIRTFLIKIFETDYHILEAANGREGMSVLNTQAPDLIISDLMMPVMDGLTFCRKVRQTEAYAHIPIIILTARTATVFQIEGFELGADAYISKPFQPNIIKARVKGLLDSRKKLREYFGKKITLQPIESPIPVEKEEFLNTLIELVESNLNNESLNRDFLAQSMAMSPSTLYRKLKAITGLTTNAFIRSIRLKRAAQLMQQSAYNISEIAYQVGFNDLKYFRTSFKKQFGVNPSDFVQELAQK